MSNDHLRKDIAGELFEAPDPDQPLEEVISYGLFKRDLFLSPLSTWTYQYTEIKLTSMILNLPHYKIH